MSSLRERMTLAIMGRTAPRAADAVLAELGYGTARCPRCGLNQAPIPTGLCPPCDLGNSGDVIGELKERLDARDAEIEQLTGQLDDTQCELTDARLELTAAETAADARHRDMLTGLRDATLRAETAEAEVARLTDKLGRVTALREAVAEDAENDFEAMQAERDEAEERAERAEAEIERLKARRPTKAQVMAVIDETADDLGAITDRAVKAEAERDRLREELRLARFDKERAEAAVARVRKLRGEVAAGPTVGLIRSLVVQELDAALDQPETP